MKVMVMKLYFSITVSEANIEVTIGILMCENPLNHIFSSIGKGQFAEVNLMMEATVMTWLTLFTTSEAETEASNGFLMSKNP